MSTSALMNLQYYLDAAQQHGEDSEPDHEVGDLQDLLRTMWSLLTPEQRMAFAKHEDVHMVLEGACVEFDEELNKL